MRGTSYTGLAGAHCQPHLVDRAAYPFESHWCDLPGGRLHYVDEGPRDAAPVVLSHGTPTWSFEWRHVIRALTPRRRCIAPDHLGFGLSDRPRDFPYTPEAHASNFRAFVDRLDLRRFALVVHDFGGPIALPVALDEPERISQLVIINTWAWSFDGDREMESRGRVARSAFGRFLYRHANASLRIIAPSAYGDRRKLTRGIHAQYLDRFPDAWSRGAVLWALANALLGSGSYYRSLESRLPRLAGVPVQVVWGLKDSAFRPAQLERWRAAVPHAEIVTLEGAGHWPHEEEPGAVSAAIARFV